MTGRMVKAYVASAMRDLIEDINRRLEIQLADAPAEKLADRSLGG